MIWSTSKQQRTSRRWKWHDGTNFQFSFHSHGVKFQHLCPDGGDGGIAFPLSSSVQISSVFKSLFFKYAVSKLERVSKWPICTVLVFGTIPQGRGDAEMERDAFEQEKRRLSASPQWDFVFQFLKCVWQHLHLHSWSYWRVTLHKAATRSLHSWSWSRCYIENTGRISQDLGACSTLAHRAGLNWTANWEYGIHLDQKHLGCLFSNFSSVSSQLIATLFRYLWPALGSASSACCGPSCAAPVTGSSGWCFPLSSLLSPRLPPLPPFVPLAWRCS